MVSRPRTRLGRAPPARWADLVRSASISSTIRARNEDIFSTPASRVLLSAVAWEGLRRFDYSGARSANMGSKASAVQVNLAWDIHFGPIVTQTQPVYTPRNLLVSIVTL